MPHSTLALAFAFLATDSNADACTDSGADSDEDACTDPGADAGTELGINVGLSTNPISG